MTSAIRISLMNGEDYPTLARLLSNSRQTHVEEQHLRAEDAAVPSQAQTTINHRGLLIGFARRRYLAWQNDKLVASGAVWRAPWTRPGSMASHVDIAQASELVLSALLDQFHTWASELGAQNVMTTLPDSSQDQRSFYQHLGYQIEAHIVEGVIDDLKPLLPGLAERFAAYRAASPLAFFRLASVDSPQLRRNLYELFRQTIQDNPGHTDMAPDFGRWQEETLDAPEACADMVFLARSGERVVGMSTVLLEKDSKSGYVDYTGVNPAYRNQGIATALKAYGALAIAESGRSRLVTEWDTSNMPIDRVNRQLGFAIRSGHYRLGYQIS